MAQILERITQSQLQRATARGILIGLIATAIPSFIDHAWLKYDYDHSIDATVAAELDSTTDDVKYVLSEIQKEPKTKRYLTIIEGLEKAHPGFTEWANENGREAYDLFNYNNNNFCPNSFRFRNGDPGCAFKDPFANMLIP